MEQQHFVCPSALAALNCSSIHRKLSRQNREGRWFRHIESIQCQKANGTDKKRVMRLLRQVRSEVLEALLFDIVIADDSAPRQLEPVQSFANYLIGRNVAMIGVVAGQEDEAGRIGKDGIQFVNDGLQVQRVLLTGGPHMQIAYMNPRQAIGLRKAPDPGFRHSEPEQRKGRSRYAAECQERDLVITMMDELATKGCAEGGSKTDGGGEGSLHKIEAARAVRPIGITRTETTPKMALPRRPTLHGDQSHLLANHGVQGGADGSTPNPSRSKRLATVPIGSSPNGAGRAHDHELRHDDAG